MEPVTLFSPAKINLGLEIFHRRALDGYHYLASIFVPISFGDHITFSPAPEWRLTTENHLTDRAFYDFEKVSERGELAKNLVWKCVTVLQERWNIPPMSVHLEKKVPTGAGLGGGSSNCGTVLRYSGSMRPIPREELLKVAVSLGADVPFFLQTGSMLVTGIGESMKSIKLGTGLGVLAIPPVFVSTAVAYGQLKRTLHAGSPPETLSSLSNEVLGALQNSRWEEAAALQNDFEKPIFQLHTELGEIKEAFLQEKAPYASLSGSGSALYGLVGDEDEQSRILLSMQKRFPSVTFHRFSFGNIFE